jgi:hypothetical protein
VGRLLVVLVIAVDVVGGARGGTGRPRDMITALGLRGSTLGMLGRFDEAIADQRQQQALLEKMGGGGGGADRAAMAGSESNIGLLLIWSGKTEEGLRRVRDALQVRASILPPRHPDLRFVYLDLAEGEILGSHPERALEPARTALELGLAGAGPESPTTALAQLLLAEALMGLDKPAEAEPLARKALALWAAHPGLPDHAARAHFVLARALGASSPREALEEAERARQGYAALESFRQANAAAVEAWTARLRASRRIKGPEAR